MRSVASDATLAAARARIARVDVLIANSGAPVGAIEGATLAAIDTTVTQLRGAAEALGREQNDLQRRAEALCVAQRRAERALETVASATVTERAVRARRNTLRARPR